jgi:hypothetical protein
MIIGVAFVLTADIISHEMYAPPAGLDMNTPDGVRAYMAQLPLTGYLILLAGPVLGAFVGAMTAGRIAKATSPRPGLIVAALMLMATIVNVLMLPHPTWYTAVCVSGVAAAGYLGAGLGTSAPARPAGA